jgi:type IV secretion system protein VirD4
MVLGRLMLMAGVLALTYGLALAGSAMPWVAAGFLCFFAYLIRRGGKRLTTLGSARWADADDLSKAGMLTAKSGLILGRLTVARTPFFPGLLAPFNLRIDATAACRQFLSTLRSKPQQLLVKLNAVHVAAFSPTGGGKGVSLVIPFLQNCPDSMVVVDLKGEIARLTADRRRAMGHDVRIVDLYKMVTHTPDTLNPLDGIDKDSPLAIDDCRDMANALVIKTGEERDPHWVDSAETFISAMLAAVVYFGEKGNRSLQTVQSLLSNPAKTTEIIRLMCDSPDAWSGMLSRMGHQLTRFKGEELASCLTTVSRFLKFLDSIAVAENTTESTFDPADLVRRKMTVYLVLPPEHVRAGQALLRLWIGTMLRAVVKGGLQEKKLVHFVLDEAATLGKMDAIDDAVDKYRGYGVRLLFLFQSIGQLKKCFPDGQDQTLLSNVSQIFFGVSDKDTAQYVSDRLGEATIKVTSGGTSISTSQQGSMGGPPTMGHTFQGSDNWAQQARRLLKPEEVANLPSRTAITFTPGVPPIWTTLIRYYEEKIPGRSRRAWDKMVMFARCVAFLGLSVLMTAFVSDTIANQITMPAFPATNWSFGQFDAQTIRHSPTNGKLSKQQKGARRLHRRPNQRAFNDPWN